jgi:undecaprenyl-diphosphatase
MNVFEAILLGIVQGLTEFLPVSSSGHLEIGNHLLGIQSSEHLLFTILVHGATALSTVVVFRKDLFSIIKEVFLFQWNSSTRFVAMILVSMVPVGIVGVFFEKEIEAFFSGHMLLVGSMLLITSALLFFTHFSPKKDGEVTFLSAIIIGIAQAVAVLPGISRSGTTISVGLLLGIEREKAARFSFLMVLLPILGASLLKVLALIKAPDLATGISAGALSAGFLAAFLAGLMACTWMLVLVKKGKLSYFAIYCAIIGGIAIMSAII